MEEALDLKLDSMTLSLDLSKRGQATGFSLVVKKVLFWTFSDQLSIPSPVGKRVVRLRYISTPRTYSSLLCHAY